MAEVGETDGVDGAGGDAVGVGDPETEMRSCNRCGSMESAPVGGLPTGWSFAVETDGRMVYQCPSCVRANIRAIEGKLPQEYWEW